MLSRTVIPEDIIEQAWELPEGTHTNVRSETFVHSPFRIVRDRKIAVIRHELDKRSLSDGQLFHVVAFPKKEHMLEFKDASTSVKKGGPAWFNPKAIGSVLMMAKRPEGPLYLRAAQSHFLGKGNSKSEAKTFGLRRELASKYGGWRKRALKEAFRTAQENGKEIWVDPVAFRGDESRKQRLLTDIKGACKDLGINIKKSELGKFPHAHIKITTTHHHKK